MASLPTSSSSSSSSCPVTPSSPAPQGQTIFSDEPTGASSPPSSPPGFPWDTNRTVPKAPPPTIKDAFSLLGKRSALDPIDDNARPSKRQATAPTPKPTGKRLSQMQISLGQKTQHKCQTCGMEYVPSSVEDRKLHDKYHKQNTEGFDVGKFFIRDTPERTHNYVLPSRDQRQVELITLVDCFDKAVRKRRARAVLDVVQRELGAVDIKDEELWTEWETKCDSKHVAYLYLLDTRCVGFLLTELIHEARTVVRPEPKEGGKSVEPEARKATALDRLKARQKQSEEPAPTLPIQLSDESTPALMGISRIWVSPQHRHKQIGMRLLDTAFKHYNKRIAKAGDPEAEEAHRHWKSVSPLGPQEWFRPLEKLAEKEKVAFSQPTEVGAALARKWFGRNFGWKVYLS